MTGHALQVLIQDADLRASFAAIWSALSGALVFSFMFIGDGIRDALDPRRLRK